MINERLASRRYHVITVLRAFTNRLTESLVRRGLLKRRRGVCEIKRGDIYFDYALSKSKLVTIMYFGVAERLPIRRPFKVYHRTLHRVYTLNKLNQSERAIYFSAPRRYRDFQLTAEVHGGSGGKPRAAAKDREGEPDPPKDGRAHPTGNALGRKEEEGLV